MDIGDRVKLHIDQGHRDALDLPDGVGTISDLDESDAKASILVRFDDVVVYLTPLSAEEIEVVGEDGRVDEG